MKFLTALRELFATRTVPPAPINEGKYFNTVIGIEIVFVSTSFVEAFEALYETFMRKCEVKEAAPSEQFFDTCWIEEMDGKKTVHVHTFFEAKKTAYDLGWKPQ